MPPNLYLNTMKIYLKYIHGNGVWGTKVYKEEHNTGFSLMVRLVILILLININTLSKLAIYGQIYPEYENA